jgi:hypothetical protein
LPAALLATAEEVKKALIETKPYRARNLTNWALTLMPGLEHLDISDWPMVDASSAWVALAGGLIAAVEEGQPSPLVTASAAWQHGLGIVGVESLEAKLIAAARAGIKTFFVSATNHEFAANFIKDQRLSVNVEVLPYAKNNPIEALEGYLRAFEVPPRGDFEKALNYFRRFPRNNTKYYLEELKSGLALQIYNSGIQAWPDNLLWPTGLALMLSKNYELALLLYETLKPQRMLLLYSQDAKKCLPDVISHLSQKNDTPSTDDSRGEFVIPLKYGGEAQGRLVAPGNELEILQSLKDWSLQIPEQSVAVEITGGTKAMTWALIVGAQAWGCEILYLDHKFDDGPVAGTERLRRLPPPVLDDK